MCERKNYASQNKILTLILTQRDLVRMKGDSSMTKVAFVLMEWRTDVRRVCNEGNYSWCRRLNDENLIYSRTSNLDRGGLMVHNAGRSADSPVKAAPAAASNMAATAIVSDVIARRGVGYDAINDVIITFPSRAAGGIPSRRRRRQVAAPCER